MAEASEPEKLLPKIEEVFSAIINFQNGMNRALRDLPLKEAGSQADVLRAELRQKFEGWGFRIDWTNPHG